MWFLMGTDGAAPTRLNPVQARNLMLNKARQQADIVFKTVKDLNPAERRAVLRTALDAFRPDAAARVERTAVEIAKRGMSPSAALREALAREMAALTLSMLSEGSHKTMLQGLADAWLDLRERVHRGEGLSGLWSGLKKIGRKALKAGGAVLKVAAKVAKGVYNVACSKVGKFAGPVVASAAGSPATGAGVAAAQNAACKKKKKHKTESRAMPMQEARPAPAIPQEKSKLPLYLALGGGALVLAILASRNSSPAPAPMVIRTVPQAPPRQIEAVA